MMSWRCKYHTKCDHLGRIVESLTYSLILYSRLLHPDQTAHHWDPLLVRSWPAGSQGGHQEVDIWSHS